MFLGDRILHDRRNRYSRSTLFPIIRHPHLALRATHRDDSIMSFRNILRKCIEKTRRMIFHALKRWTAAVWIIIANHRERGLSARPSKDVEADSSLPYFGHGLIGKGDSEKLASKAIEGGLLRGHDQVRLRPAGSMAAEALHDLATVQQPGKQPSNVCHHCTLHFNMYKGCTGGRMLSLRLYKEIGIGSSKNSTKDYQLFKIKNLRISLHCPIYSPRGSNN